MASQLTSWMGQTTGFVFGGARMLRIRWMSLAVGPVSGAYCAAWARVGEGRSSQRRGRTRWRTWRVLSASRSWGMVASAFRVRSAMARLGPDVACVGSSGRRPSDGLWGGALLEGGWSHRQVLNKV